jgi:hypothetical protein
MDFSIQSVFFAHFNALYKSQERGPIQFLKLGVIPNQAQPLVGGLLVLLESFKLGGGCVRCSSLSLRSAS